MRQHKIGHSTVTTIGLLSVVNMFMGLSMDKAHCDTKCDCLQTRVQTPTPAMIIFEMVMKNASEKLHQYKGDVHQVHAT